MSKGKKYGADETGKTFGPGHDGWYLVSPGATGSVVSRLIFKKDRSAFGAAQQAGFSLSECSVAAITDSNLIERLDNNQLEQGWET